MEPGVTDDGRPIPPPHRQRIGVALMTAPTPGEARRPSPESQAGEHPSQSTTEHDVALDQEPILLHEEVLEPVVRDRVCAARAVVRKRVEDRRSGYHRRSAPPARRDRTTSRRQRGRDSTARALGRRHLGSATDRGGNRHPQTARATRGGAYHHRIRNRAADHPRRDPPGGGGGHRGIGSSVANLRPGTKAASTVVHFRRVSH